MVMEKNEHIIFQDIPGSGNSGKYHSAVLTTFCVDIMHFDAHLRNVLHKKQICSINVFADKDQLDDTIKYTSPLFLHNIGRDYTVTGISSVGAFHPKINFFVGENNVLVLIGSGNLTVTGQGKNHEIFTGFMIDDKDERQRPLVEECWRYIRSIASHGSPFDKRRILQEIPDNCRYLKTDYSFKPHAMCEIGNDLKAALLYADSTGILKQITEIVPQTRVSKITIVSPFFDENGETLEYISNLFPNSDIEVLLQDNCILPPYAMKKDKRIRFFDFDATKRGQQVFSTNDSFNRLAHAKIYVFETKNGQYCLIGSANATVPGLGTMKNKGANDEFCVMYYSKKQDFIGILGLKGRKILKTDFKDYKPTAHQSSTKKESLPVTINYAECSSGILSVSLSVGKQKPSGMKLVLDNGMSTVSTKKFTIDNGIIRIKISDDKQTLFCYFTDSSDTAISNTVCINVLDRLDSTNPSKTNRTINNLISKIENEGYNGLELSEMLSSVMADLYDETTESKTVIRKYYSGGDKEKERDADLPDVTFNPDYEETDDMISHSSGYDGSSRLIVCIEDSIRKKLRSLDDDLKDEEESGNTVSSNERSVIEERTVTVSKNWIERIGGEVSTLLDDYQKLINRRIKDCATTGNRTVLPYDFNYFSLAMFASLEICFLNHLNYSLDEISEIDRNYYRKRLTDVLNGCLISDCSETLAKFTTFCKKNWNGCSKDDGITVIAHRAVKYALLYVAVFERISKYIQVGSIREDNYNNLQTLIDLFGIQDYPSLKEELDELSDRYDNVFRFRLAEGVLEKLGIITN